MSDPYQPPVEPPPASISRTLEVTVLWVLAGLCALIMLINCGAELFSLLAALQAHMTHVGLFPRILRSLAGVVLCGGSAAFFAGAAITIAHPERFGREAFAAVELERIYQSEHLGEREQGPQGDYAEHEDSDLAHIYVAIDRALVPHRFEELMAAIKQRVESRQPPDGG